MTKEKAKRLKPTPETLRRLSFYSGNLCAFPNCLRLMMNGMGDFVGQVCHIEAAEEGGQRFNRNMSNEDRRSFDNLMLMCYEHHIETNNVKEFPVNRLVEMKREHERRFSAPDRAILERLTDWTTLDEPTGVSNLMRLNEVLDLRQSEEELAEMIEELNEYIDGLSLVPIEVRRFVGAIAQRMFRVANTSAVQTETFGTNILISDVKQAYRLGNRTINEKLAELESYGLGGLDQMFSSDLGPLGAIRIRALPSSWHVWLDVVAFCEETNTPSERFTDDLDFSAFDDVTANQGGGA
ncbi:MAG: hypothetical protein ACRDGA_01735 [Bacteroidota bacterium]